MQTIPLNEILDHFGLSPDQRRASAERQVDVAVTAGAGSGKTRTLVARYVSLLSEGLSPRQVVAITFTEKAAREMRTRVRQELRRLTLAAAPSARQVWAELEAQMDSARIGTIHSLCAEILRSHPAETGLDPQFGVTEDSQTVQLRRAAVEAALLWAVDEPAMLPLFAGFTLGQLETLLTRLLGKRLDVSPTAFDPAAGQSLLGERLGEFLNHEAVCTALAELRLAKADGSLLVDAGDKLAEQLTRLLELIDAAEQAHQSGDGLGCALALCQARQSSMGLTVGKKTSRARETLRELRDLYDTRLGAWLGSKEPPDVEVETQVQILLPLLQALFDRAETGYRAGLDERQALDFDDLEAGALALLRLPAVQARWQAEVAAVLVDEFQDTNARQRELVQLLTGEQPGRLFVVGDARQSIYRFRGADVTVFTSLQHTVRLRGGLSLDLDRTFRAHAALLEATGSLLRAVMGSQPDPQRPFYVPFAPLQAERQTPRPNNQEPFVECVLGTGADSESGRQAAAQALAQRLVELRQAGEIASWDAVTLLFRASTGFPFYEAAFEAAGIPFVTVAGSGFYDRPEVRDLLNLMRALSDPWDDQALAGLLRSPAVGLSDPALYRLRVAGSPTALYRPLRQALTDYPNLLPSADHPAAQRALDLLAEFEPLVDRLPVAELLRRLIARTDLLAVLAAAPSRLWRNAGKLLSDAQRSGLVRVRAFLEYVDSLRDVGAREGEAISEAAGAVRLMTIHKSKGLEFPVVVLADAARQMNAGREGAYPLSEAGRSCWAVAPNQLNASPLVFRLARHLENQQSEAENGRLLYVALTRAKEKLIISGHLTVNERGPSCRGWLNDLLMAGGADLATCLAEAGTPQLADLPGGGRWRVWVAPPQAEPATSPPALHPEWPKHAAPFLAAPLATAAPTRPAAVPSEENATQWEQIFQGSPTQVIGGLVHECLRRWGFAAEPGPALDAFLQRYARQAGLTGPDAADEVVTASRRLLNRFRRHPLWQEIQSAPERYQSIPVQTQDRTEYIDVLYRTPTGWHLVDFHTSPLRQAEGVQANLDLRRPILQEICQAVHTRLGVTPQVSICFLDAEGQVLVRAVT